MELVGATESLYDDVLPAAFSHNGSARADGPTDKHPSPPPRRDLFLEACGASQPLRLEARSGPHCIRRTLWQPFALIGRDVRCDLRLDDHSVSRRHAYVQVIDGRVFWLDLRSRSGVTQRGELRATGWLQPGDSIKVGSFELTLLEEDEEGIVTPAWQSDGTVPPEPLPPPAELTLRMASRPRECWTWDMKRHVALVGSDGACKVHLEDTTVSRQHCVLVRTRLGVWVVDLASRQGTLLNGVRVRAGRLIDGDRLQIGPYVLDTCYERTREGQLVSHPLVRTERDQLHAISSRLMPATLAIPNHEAVTGQSTGQVSSDVAALISQFGQMQQRTFDQFQQAFMMMAQMFATLYREQMAVVRQELEQIQTLTRELGAYQSQLAAYLPLLPAANSVVAGTNPAPTSDMQTLEPSQETDEGAEQLALMESMLNAAMPPLENAREAAAATAAQPREEGSQASIPSSCQSPQEIHAWLSQQISAIQQERQTRWEKIAKFFAGK